MRKINIEDKKILDVLNRKGALTTENQAILKEMGELEKKFNTCLTKSKMLDEKSRPMIKKLTSTMEFGEYEEISAVRQGDKGNWYIEVADRLEEFKTMMKKSKK